MVTPIGVEDAQLGFPRVAALTFEIAHHLVEVGGAHGQTMRGAELLILVGRHLGETRQVFHRAHLSLFRQRQHVEVFGTAFHRVNIIVGNLC